MEDTLPSKNGSGWYPRQEKPVPNGSTRTHGQVWVQRDILLHVSSIAKHNSPITLYSLAQGDQLDPGVTHILCLTLAKQDRMPKERIEVDDDNLSQRKLAPC
jgi:hypothetical protein